ncbi:MAG: hypothetical protein JSR80_04200 [Verrucomicrobia bacterium]|nr:hypothetical protein [Verrucomicrobiota bacterium]
MEVKNYNINNDIKLTEYIKKTALIHPEELFSLSNKEGNDLLKSLVITKMFWQIRDSFATNGYRLDLSQPNIAYHIKQIRPLFFFEILAESSAFELPLKEGLLSINREGVMTFGDKEAIYIYDCHSLKENTPFKSMEEYDLFNIYSLSPKELITIDANQDCTLWNLRDPFANTLRIANSLSSLGHISSADTPALETVPGCQWACIGNSYLQAVTLTSRETSPKLPTSILSWAHVGGATHFVSVNEEGHTVLSSEKCSSCCNGQKSAKETVSNICAITLNKNDIIALVRNAPDPKHLIIEEFEGGKLIGQNLLSVNFTIDFLKSFNSSFGNVFVGNKNGSIAKIDVEKKEFNWSVKLIMSFYQEQTSKLQKIELATHMDSKILIISDTLGYLSFFDAEDGSFIKKLDIYYSKEWFVFQQDIRFKILSNETRNETNYLITYEAFSEENGAGFDDLSLPPKPKLSVINKTFYSVDETPKIREKRKRPDNEN